MGQFHFTPDDYLDLMHAELPAYDELQERVATATRGRRATRILELGTGTGETSRRVLDLHPQARLTGVDVSDEMLTQARRTLPAERIDGLLVQRIEDPLPSGPFDLAISALAVHHLDGPAKAELFERIASSLGPGGRFVMGDVIVPAGPAEATTPLEPGYDLPSSIDELLAWLSQAGFEARVVWDSKDLAVFSADLPPRSG